jgi:putative tryptophan/tyrosine transport system substrate-binding protein
MRRREFIAGLGSAVGWPGLAHAQQRERMRRVGVLMSWAADDPESQRRLGAFLQGLQELGWGLGRNVQIDYRWVAGKIEKARPYAAELVALAPDVVVTSQGTLVRALQQASRNVPIVFAGVIDPVASGRIESLARPGGNATGFTAIEYGISGKWLELLKKTAPQVTRVAVPFEMRSGGPGGPGQYGALQNAAPSLGMELHPVGIDNAVEIEDGISAFARGSNDGMIVTMSARAILHRDLITSLAARYRLPAVYPDRIFVDSGGLISYGLDQVEQYRLAAGYVSRILKGEKTADLPVQAPTKFELVINLKTAKTLGLTIPETLRATSDEVIQ